MFVLTLAAAALASGVPAAGHLGHTHDGGSGVAYLASAGSNSQTGPPVIDWDANVTHLRGLDGEQYTFTCPPDGSPYSIWGTDVYTDDSSVCTAAVHVGLITLTSGGVVTVEIRPGEASYAASDWNGVSSSSYGSWHRQLRVPARPGHHRLGRQRHPPARPERPAGQLHLPAGRNSSQPIWGTDVYTDDSSVCTAAVHAGLVTFESGGVATLRIRPGKASYTASDRFGVASNSYGAWDGSFVFVASSTAFDWESNVTDLRGLIGEQYTFTCPPGGTRRNRSGAPTSTPTTPRSAPPPSTLGSSPSSPGGVVTVEIRPGEASYAASDRYGVSSSSYGSWSGSFAFPSQP